MAFAQLHHMEMSEEMVSADESRGYCPSIDMRLRSPIDIVQCASSK